MNKLAILRQVLVTRPGHQQLVGGIDNGTD